MGTEGAAEDARQRRLEQGPSVPITMRHRLIGSLALRAEVTTSDGYQRGDIEAYEATRRRTVVATPVHVMGAAL